MNCKDCKKPMKKFMGKYICTSCGRQSIPISNEEAEVLADVKKEGGLKRFYDKYLKDE
jgi:uncharacterized Zn finger protein (UPF0148 family)